jgi:hypothetical protein
MIKAKQMKFSTAIFKTFFLSLCMIANVNFAYAQNAAILPNAKTTFNDANGKPLTSGTVDFYVPGTTTRKTTWQDSGETTPNTNPVVLDAAGRALIWGDGAYRQVVKDRNGNLIWDQVTASAGSGSSGSTIGDGLSVGTILPTSDIVAPVNYQFAYGQAVSRSGFPELKSALTITTPIGCTGGSAIITLSDTTSIAVGAVLESICVSGSPTVISKTSGSVTLSSNSVITVATNGVFFPYGNGDALTTFNLPDLRGYTVTGRCNMGGVNCSNLNSTYFSSNTNNTPSGLNAKGGSQSSILVTGNLPPQTPSGSNSSSSSSNADIVRNAAGIASSNATAGGNGQLIGTSGLISSITVNPQTFTGNPFPGQNSNPFANIPPTITLNYIIKVTPDVNLASTFGVASIGGMTGVIACGTNITCAGNTISVNFNGVASIQGMTGNITCNNGIYCGNNSIGPTNTALYAQSYGVKCDGATDDAASLQSAIAAADTLGGVPIILPAGSCVLSKTVYLNKYAASGILTVPGLKMTGQGKDVTTIDMRGTNSPAIAINPDWQGSFQALSGTSAETVGGSLATNTYFMQISVTSPNGEVRTTLPKSIAVTGPTGQIRLTLPNIHFNDGYCYNILLDTAATPTHYATVAGVDAVCLGGNQTVVATAVSATSHTVPTTRNSIWQNAQIDNLTITSTTSAAGASGISYFKAGYAGIDNIYFKNLLGTGFLVPDYTGDIDGSFVITVNNSKFDNIAGWCTDASGLALELSNLSILNSSYNLCGTATTNLNTNFTMSAITNANPGIVTTSSNHTLQGNDQIYIQNVAGMTLAAGWYRVCNSSIVAPTSNTFGLCNLSGGTLDTTALGAYTASSGTESLSWRPPTSTTGSGAIRYMGLISTFKNLGFTQNQNVNIYFTEAGTSDNTTIEGVDFENTYGKGMYIASLAGGSISNSECLSTNALGPTISCIQLGTGFNAGGVQNFKVQNMKVRNDVNPTVGFEQFQNTNNGATFSSTNRVNNITWQTFDAAGQTRFNGFLFDILPGSARFSVTGVGTAQIIPVGYSGQIPLHLKANGEWINYQVPNAGITAGGLTGLSNNTQYYFYLYNSAATSAPIAGALEISASVPTLESVSGVYVKTGDSTRTYVGTATTNGSGQITTNGTDISWYPAYNIPQGQIPGTTSNSSAAAGNVGEFISSTLVVGSCTALTTGTAKTITSVSLTAGDWDVNGVAAYLPANTTTTTNLSGSISIVNNTLDTTTGNFIGQNTPATTYNGATQAQVSISPIRYSLAATTTVYLIGFSNFATSTNCGFGTIRARRIR